MPMIVDGLKKDLIAAADEYGEAMNRGYTHWLEATCEQIMKFRESLVEEQDYKHWTDDEQRLLEKVIKWFDMFLGPVQAQLDERIPEPEVGGSTVPRDKYAGVVAMLGRRDLEVKHLRKDLEHLQHEPGADSCAGFCHRHHTLEEALAPLENDICDAVDTNADWEKVAIAMGWEQPDGQD